MISAEHEFSRKEKAFREDVRNFLKDAFTPDLQAAAARQAGVFAEPELGIAWQRRLYERGWGAPNWPNRWGGAEFTPMQRYIFSVECANAGTPVVAGMGLLMCGPVLMQFGTAEQQERFLPHIPPMDHYWCQGFSEPGAGSRCKLDIFARKDVTRRPPAGWNNLFALANGRAWHHRSSNSWDVRRSRG